MPEQLRHAVLPEPSHDERAREDFIATMRETLVSEVYPKVGARYDTRLKPRFIERHGREPSNRHEVAAMFEADTLYQAFSLLNRATQELLWDTVGDSVERQLPCLQARRGAIPPAGGSLSLDPDFVAPRYIDMVDIHVMPGNFHTETSDDDLLAGAIYDRGVYIYAYSGLGPLNDGLGQITAAFVREHFPDVAPRRILDLGCGVGHGTLPLLDIFPGAEVHAVDVGAPMLRYGHSRAEALGKPVHFHQMDASRTSFPDGHFDLIVSNLLFHEVPRKTIRGIIRECYRLLAGGGVMAHHDMLGWPKDPLGDFLTDWNTHHNNEPFSRGSGTIDFVAECQAAGFHPDDVFVGSLKAAYLAEQLESTGVRGARKRANG